MDELDADRGGALALDVSECQCIGMEVRAFGFKTGRDLFADTDLTIRAEAGADCAEGIPDNDCVECGPDGDAERLTEVTFRNEEGGEKEITIERKDGNDYEKVFPDNDSFETIEEDDTFTLEAGDSGNPQFRFKVDDREEQVRHPNVDDDEKNDYFSVSCSKPVRKEMRLHTDEDEVMHEISVVSAEDKDGNEIC